MHSPKHLFRPLLTIIEETEAAEAPTLRPPPRGDEDGAAVSPAAVPQRDSHIRLREVPANSPRLRGSVEWLEAQDLLDELCDDQLVLSMNLGCLERSSLERPRNLCAVAALRSIELRLRDLANVRDALAVLQLSTIAKSVHRAFLPDAPLADYLRGVYAWSHAVVKALDELVSGLTSAQPDWASYRWRIEEAKNFHFFELEDAIIDDLAALLDEGADEGAVRQLRRAFRTLLDAARELEARLDEGL
jgi:hypothetical protein